MPLICNCRNRIGSVLAFVFFKAACEAWTPASRPEYIDLGGRVTAAAEQEGQSVRVDVWPGTATPVIAIWSGALMNLSPRSVSPRTSKFRGHGRDEISLDEVERIAI